MNKDLPQEEITRIRNFLAEEMNLKEQPIIDEAQVNILLLLPAKSVDPVHWLLEVLWAAWISWANEHPCADLRTMVCRFLSQSLASIGLLAFWSKLVGTYPFPTCCRVPLRLLLFWGHDGVSTHSFCGIESEF